MIFYKSLNNFRGQGQKWIIYSAEIKSPKPKDLLKFVSKLSTESSFCIYINRNNRDRKPRDQPAPIVKISEPGNITPLPKSSVKTKPTWSRNELCEVVGFINKGNTCYDNSILQALSLAPIIWCRLPSEPSIMSPVWKATS